MGGVTTTENPTVSLPAPSVVHLQMAAEAHYALRHLTEQRFVRALTGETDVPESEVELERSAQQLLDALGEEFGETFPTTLDGCTQRATEVVNEGLAAMGSTARVESVSLGGPGEFAAATRAGLVPGLEPQS